MVTATGVALFLGEAGGRASARTATVTTAANPTVGIAVDRCRELRGIRSRRIRHRTEVLKMATTAVAPFLVEEGGGVSVGTAKSTTVAEATAGMTIVALESGEGSTWVATTATRDGISTQSIVQGITKIPAAKTTSLRGEVAKAAGAVVVQGLALTTVAATTAAAMIAWVRTP